MNSFQLICFLYMILHNIYGVMYVIKTLTSWCSSIKTSFISIQSYTVLPKLNGDGRPPCIYDQLQIFDTNYFGIMFLFEGKEFRESCGGHGRYLLGRCKCDKLYYGEKCQFKNECADNADCGFQGECVDLDATTFPKKQCYCHLGWFGPRCAKSMYDDKTQIQNIQSFYWKGFLELSLFFENTPW